MNINLVKKIVTILNDKKAQDIKLIDISQVSQLADYFIICSATSSTHVKTLSDEIEFHVEDKHNLGFHKEGNSDANWVLLDYKDVIVHIFYGETRDFYNLEHLWADGNMIDIDELLQNDGKE